MSAAGAVTDKRRKLIVRLISQARNIPPAEPGFSCTVSGTLLSHGACSKALFPLVPIHVGRLKVLTQVRAH